MKLMQEVQLNQDNEIAQMQVEANLSKVNANIKDLTRQLGMTLGGIADTDSIAGSMEMTGEG